MTTVLMLFCLQCLLGGFDNLWHHEIQARLPRQPTARKELAFHAAREIIYGLVFFGVAWRQWEGLWALVLIAILAAEIVITICDFLEEDRTRRLPPLERVLHTVMALVYGGLLAVWVPELWRWMQAPTGLVRTSYDWLSWLMTMFAAGVSTWGLRDLAAVARLGVPDWQRHPMYAGSKPDTRTVLVTGGTGFVGRALVRALLAWGDRVIVLSRNPSRARDGFGPPVEVCGDLAEIDTGKRIHAIVNLAGEPLAGGLWTAGRKRRFLESRVRTTENIIGLISRLHQRPDVLVCASAVGYYGDRGNEILDESSRLGQGYLPDLTRQCESAAEPARALGVRLCWLRFGYVLGREGGLLRSMIPAVRLGGGAVIGPGTQWMSWIHVRDAVRLIQHVLEHPGLDGVVNAVAPMAVTQRSFTRKLAVSLRRPVLVRLPAGLLSRVLGQMTELLVSSQNVAPTRALAAGFRFEYEDLDCALSEIAGSNQSLRTVARRVYANYDCPVCSAEMAKYRQAAERCGADIEFIDAAGSTVRTAAYGLTETDLRRRLFVLDSAGCLRSGIDAFAAIWSQLPALRWLGWLARTPLCKPALELLYDLVCAPALTQWNARRLRRSAATMPHAGTV
ncbi:MAG: TIGR01777 family protein [Nevskia sp.]|nr:TIGR01777 family protein [Nevskia sp.]